MKIFREWFTSPWAWICNARAHVINLIAWLINHTFRFLNFRFTDRAFSLSPDPKGGSIIFLRDQEESICRQHTQFIMWHTYCTTWPLHPSPNLIHLCPNQELPSCLCDIIWSHRNMWHWQKAFKMGIAVQIQNIRDSLPPIPPHHFKFTWVFRLGGLYVSWSSLLAFMTVFACHCFISGKSMVSKWASARSHRNTWNDHDL